ncbi:hypothetical protein BABINDRAFT_16300, partial [Babjeviella inositovora NRRL Y-12698]
STLIPLTAPLPPVNLQSLREIDLHEILKNPQLRHDILFDPQLQFRPNLDGERGRRKKAMVDKYWTDVEKECMEYATATMHGGAPTKVFSAQSSRLPALFTTLREILLLLLPLKDRPAVNDVMDTELLIQQLNRGTFDFVSLAHWLAGVFKSHCAPMRDSWVDDMTAKFVEADSEKTVGKLVEGLRTIFAILEAMKLDVANHQIRVLRPVLVETAVEFERDYFSQMISRCKLDITDSLNWYRRSYVKREKKNGKINKNSTRDLRNLCVAAILDLLSCRYMVSEFPSSLTFDHARLVLLRADIRQSVCLQLCTALYRQLLGNYPQSAAYRVQAVLKASLDELRLEILAIITDDNGNVKWTRNVGAIALQLTKKAITPPAKPVSLLKPATPLSGTATPPPPPDSLIEFAFNWLIKQIQPSSEIYKLMEERVFAQLLEKSAVAGNQDIVGVPTTPATAVAAARSRSGTPANNVPDDIQTLSIKISTLARFHWNVFGSYYTEYVS